MKRREFIAAATAFSVRPFTALAQQSGRPLIGYLSSASPGDVGHLARAFRDGLRQSGFVEGENLLIEYRWAEDRYERLRPLAADLLSRNIKVLVATGGPASALAAKEATHNVPVVFTGPTDPVGLGLVQSLNRPGANVTGIAGLTTELDPKRLELLREVVPSAEVIGALVNSNRPNVAAQTSELQRMGKAIRQEIVVLNVATEQDFQPVLATTDEQGIRAVLVTADGLFNSRRRQLIEALARYRLPAVFPFREPVPDGGLLSYGASLAEIYREGAIYVARILKGEKPAELPVAQPTKFELLINLRTASALGLTIPPILLARADEVIE
jgi:putative ABC transport system substrate-binding protein